MKTRILTLTLMLLLQQACTTDNGPTVQEEHDVKSSDELVSTVQPVQPDMIRLKPPVNATLFPASNRNDPGTG